MAVTISGMFGGGLTYLCDSPVIITVSGLSWPNTDSPFKVVYVDVIYDGDKVGEYRKDTEGATSADFDISSALQAIWSDYGFTAELKAAAKAVAAPWQSPTVPPETINAGYVAETDAEHSAIGSLRFRSYALKVRMEYVDRTTGGFVTDVVYSSSDIGLCVMGGLTEWERFNMKPDDPKGLVYLNSRAMRNERYGDASTKPKDMPERVGRYSITSWADLTESGSRTFFFPFSAATGQDSTAKHAPIVLRDTQDYADFLFVNRRGAVETCCALTKESMNVETETKQYSLVEGPVFIPTRSLTSQATPPRRSWQMSSGLVTREWAEWWAADFLAARRHWMRFPIGAQEGKFLPVIIEPARKSTDIYDRAKQQMPHVEFTVTLMTEG